MSLFNIEEIGNVPSGTRLSKLEVYNWGTFDQKAWSFNTDGKTALLTGDSGSGKSTLVDALTTLLLPPRKISYNKAADASAKERNNKSYVLGYYGRKYNLEGRGKPEALRSTNSYSVILATFKNEVKDDISTLAIFFWFKDNDTNPSKLYVTAERELSIASHFVNFNSNIKNLKINLKSEGCELYDNYKSYSHKFRRMLGNVSEQAIELFQQTISMKKVDALNEFVRESMLEYENPEADINSLLKHYENLNEAYLAVTNAENKIDKLSPICKKGKTYQTKLLKRQEMEAARTSSELWFATQKDELISDELKKTFEQINQVNHSLEIENKNEKRCLDQQFELKQAIAENGGNESTRLSQLIASAQVELERITKENQKYSDLAKNLKLHRVSSISDFQANKNKLINLITNYKNERMELQAKVGKTSYELEVENVNLSEAENELESLKNRTSNIPDKLVRLRTKMCQQLNLSPELIPFAGELLEVKSNELKWEGAIERLVHGFAISLLVAEEHYSQVATWINNNSLGTKVVYFKTSASSMSFNQGNHESVYNKLLIKQETMFTTWLENEMKKRFAHVCTESIEAFKQEPKAITLNGQIKSNIRHEKDDRRNLNDRKRYVLGFSNEKKIEALNKEIGLLETKLRELRVERSRLNKQDDIIVGMLNSASKLQEYTDYSEIDVEPLTTQLKVDRARLVALEQNNDKLKILKQQLLEAEAEQKQIKFKISNLQNQGGQLTSKKNNYEEQKELNDLILEQDVSIHTAQFEYLQQNYKKFVGNNNITINNAQILEKKYSDGLTQKCEKLQKELSTAQADIEKAMAKFRVSYPSESIELSESINAIDDYKQMYDQLLYHNLPKYKYDFKNELEGKIIRHISLFNGQLLKQRNKIEGRIREINNSLYDIDYNVGRYIRIICETTPESEIVHFRQQLKKCTEGMYSSLDDEQVTLKFKEIQSIIERFRGRPDSIEADKRWTRRVTDVRNWFVFSASESWRDSDVEYEHYADSDGKSGGQKEKLAYTILAASLAYNYRLHDIKTSSNAFRLVVIDEAFLKSSDESAKFGLGLFKQLNFQLLVVTPLLKISTIEPYVDHVGYVSHDDTNHTSSLQNIDKQTFKEKLNRK